MSIAVKQKMSADFHIGKSAGIVAIATRQVEVFKFQSHTGALARALKLLYVNHLALDNFLRTTRNAIHSFDPHPCFAYGGHALFA